MVFTKENGILIKVLRQSKGYSARKLLGEFPDRTNFCVRLALQGLQTGSPAAAEKYTACTRDMQMSVQMATTFSINCN